MAIANGKKKLCLKKKRIHANLGDLSVVMSSIVKIKARHFVRDMACRKHEALLEKNTFQQYLPDFLALPSDR